ncbi:MAG: aminoglycoside phosphotransferase family protein [Actinomycetes bacterium]
MRDLLYGRRSRRILRTALADLLLPGATLGACRLDRAKYKPARKLTGYYLVDVHTQQGRTTRAIEVVWSGGSPPSAELARTESAMEDEAHRAGICSPFRSLRLDVTSLGARVRVSPLDADFPHLVQLSTPSRVRDLLAGVVEGRAAPEYSVSTVRYRPRQRHVLRYDAAGSDGVDSVFAKLYRPGAARRAADIAAAVADRVERGRPDITAVRPLAGSASSDVLLYPRVAGGPLSARLWDRAPLPSRHLPTAGAVLRALHEGTAEPTPDLARRDVGGEITAVARAAEHLVPLLPVAADRVGRLLERARVLSDELPGEPDRFAHGDFKADHVWAAGDQLTLLDFDTCCLAEPALDIGKFLADLSFWYAMTSRPGLVAAQEAFLSGYGGLPEERLARVRLVEAVVMTKLVIRRLRRFDARWSERTEALTRSAERLLTVGPLAAPAPRRPADREPAVTGRV